MKTALILACDDGYIPFTSVVARRIAAHASEKFPIIVLSDGVTDENKTLARKFCPEISFIEASHIFNNRSFPIRNQFTRAAFMRMFLDEVAPDLDYAVYLDSDISVLTDISPLVAMKPKAAPIIAAYDLPITMEGKYRTRLPVAHGAPYFNSGVMVMDLRAIRSEGIFARAIDFALRRPELCIYVDQDALNIAFDGQWQVLDWRWNAITFMLDRLPKSPFIRHLTGNKPWSPQKHHIEQRFIDEWRFDLSESPWPHRFEQPLPPPRKPIVKTARREFLDKARRLFYRESRGRRGNMYRFERHLPLALHSIEAAAADAQLADRFPEVTLIRGEN